MKVTFFHDHRFKVDYSKNYYSLGGLSNDTFKSYLNYFEKVRVVSRVEDQPDNFNPSNYTKVKLDDLEMDCIKNVSQIELLGFKGFRKKIKEKVENSEVIIARVPSFIGTLALEEAQKQNKPIIVEVVANAWDGLWNYGTLSGKILAPIMQLRNKRVIKKATDVIYVTEKYLQRIYPTNGRSMSISNVVLTDLNEDVLRHRMNKKPNKILKIGTIGNLETVAKGQKYVIEALPLLISEINVEYQLVGSGDKTRLDGIAKKNNVSDNVKFIGSLSREDIFKWLDTIDIYIQPSKQEGLPRALIEAMSRGVPCLGSSTAGIPELLEENMIFSNNNKRIDIYNKIIDMSKINTNEVSRRNFLVSQKYEKRKLDDKRIDFYNNFTKNFLND